ncbi:hypothetical protein D9M68_713360 [compost metagenome]
MTFPSRQGAILATHDQLQAAGIIRAAEIESQGIKSKRQLVIAQLILGAIEQVLANGS